MLRGVEDLFVDVRHDDIDAHVQIALPDADLTWHQDHVASFRVTFEAVGMEVGAVKQGLAQVVVVISHPEPSEFYILFSFEFYMRT